MTNRIYVPLLGAAAVVYAWGPLTHAAEHRSSGTLHDTVQHASLSLNNTIKAKAAAKTRVETSTSTPLKLDPVVDVHVAKGRDVEFAMRVRNGGDKRVELTFPTAQTHDFIVRDESGREVWRWSDGRMFTSTLQSKVVDGRDTMSFEGTWSAPRPGRYTVHATLASGNHPLVTNASFQVP